VKLNKRDIGGYIAPGPPKGEKHGQGYSLHQQSQAVGIGCFDIQRHIRQLFPGGMTNRNVFSMNGVSYDTLEIVLRGPQVAHPDCFIMLGELPNGGGIGKENFSQCIFDTEQSYSALPLPESSRYGLHSGAYRFNYLFADGHVKTWRVQATAINPSGGNPEKWWTASGDDD
jgi:prepilin-type processing-associated H-X9-DG protein